MAILSYSDSVILPGNFSYNTVILLVFNVCFTNALSSCSKVSMTFYEDSHEIVFLEVNLITMDLCVSFFSFKIHY